MFSCTKAARNTTAPDAFAMWCVCGIHKWTMYEPNLAPIEPKPQVVQEILEFSLLGGYEVLGHQIIVAVAHGGAFHAVR